MKVKTGEAKPIVLSIVLTSGFLCIIPSRYSYFLIFVFFVVFFVFRKIFTRSVSRYFRLVHLYKNKWGLSKCNQSLLLFCTAPRYRIIRSLEKDIETALQNAAHYLPANSYIVMETWLFKEKFLKRYQSHHKNNQFLSGPIVEEIKGIRSIFPKLSALLVFFAAVPIKIFLNIQFNTWNAAHGILYGKWYAITWKTIAQTKK